MYRKRNEVERLFRRLKGYRRIFSRFEKLDVMFIVFIYFALIAEGSLVLTGPRLNLYWSVKWVESSVPSSRCPLLYLDSS